MCAAPLALFSSLRTRLGSLTCVVIRIELCGAVIPLRPLLTSLFLIFLVFLVFSLTSFVFLVFKPFGAYSVFPLFCLSTFSFLALADKSLLTDFWTLSA